jgi:hypothetical protein
MLSQGRNNGLRALPLPDAILGSPWSLITTKELASALNADPAAINTWVYRGVAPIPEPAWFRGSVRVFRVDKIQTWLAQRHRLVFDQDTAWAEGLERINFEPEPDVRDQVRRLVELLGPEWALPPGCRWSVGGFAAYLDSLVTF